MWFFGFVFLHVTIKNSKHMVTDTKDMNHESFRNGIMSLTLPLKWDLTRAAAALKSASDLQLLELYLLNYSWIFQFWFF